MSIEKYFEDQAPSEVQEAIQRIVVKTGAEVYNRSASLFV